MSENEKVKGCSCGNADYGAPGHDGGPEYRDTTNTGDDDGLVTARVAGIDAHLYAHRSTTVPGALLIGVDAPEGQRILFVVNDGDVLDTTVGEPLPGEVTDATSHAGSLPGQIRGSQLDDSIAKGHFYATVESRYGTTRGRTELVSDAITNLLLFLADADGAEAATKAAADGAENFRADWLEAGCALSVPSSDR